MVNHPIENQFTGNRRCITGIDIVFTPAREVLACRQSVVLRLHFPRNSRTLILRVCQVLDDPHEPGAVANNQTLVGSVSRNGTDLDVGPVVIGKVRDLVVLQIHRDDVRRITPRGAGVSEVQPVPVTVQPRR